MPQVDAESKDASLSLTEKQDAEALVPPDGGAKAWACVAGSFLLQFCSFGYVNA